MTPAEKQRLRDEAAQAPERISLGVGLGGNISSEVFYRSARSAVPALLDRVEELEVDNADERRLNEKLLMDHHEDSMAISEVMADIARLRAELDAYKRAKAENDERFMIERDEARNEAARLRASNAALMAAKEEACELANMHIVSRMEVLTGVARNGDGALALCQEDYKRLSVIALVGKESQ